MWKVEFEIWVGIFVTTYVLAEDASRARELAFDSIRSKNIVCIAPNTSTRIHEMVTKERES